MVLPVLSSGGGVIAFRQGVLAAQIMNRTGPLLLPESMSVPLLTSAANSSNVAAASWASMHVQGQFLFHAGVGKFAVSAMKFTGSPGVIYTAGVNIGNKGFGFAIIKAGEKVVTKAITRVGGQFTAKALPAIFNKIGALITGLGAGVGLVVGAIVGFIIGKILEKIPWKKVKELAAPIFGVSVFLVTVPIVGTMGALGFGVGASAVSAGFGAGFGGLTSKGIGGGIKRIIKTIGKYFVLSLGLPMLIFLLSAPVLIAVILFVINSGAYIVPPNTYITNSIYNAPGTYSPYIDVQKTNNLSDTIQNSQLPITVEYTITISAKKGPLKNIKIQDQCQIIKDGKTPSCPSSDKAINEAGGVEIPPTITPGHPFVFTYKRNLMAGLENSVLTDTITVTADADDQADTKASASSSIVIGNPPTGCFTFDSSWNTSDKAKMMLAVAKITKAKTYSSILCNGAPIVLHRIGGGSGCGGGGGMVMGNTINIYNAGVNCTDFVTYYTLAHETGHIYSARTKKYQNFLDSGVTSEGLICTYPNTLTQSEDFAEMIALYYTKVAGSTKARCMSGNLKSAYPLHWKFAHDNIFIENLDW